MKPPSSTLRLAASFGLLGVMLLVVGWLGISHLRQLNSQMQEIVYEPWQEELLSHQAYRLSSQNSQITLLVFLLDDPNEIQKLLVQRAANTQRITELIAAIKSFVDNADEAQLFAAVEATRIPYVESYQRALALLLTEHQSDAARKMMVEVVRPNLIAYQNAWGAFNQYEVDEVIRVLQQSKIDFARGQRDFLLTLAAAGLITGVIAFFTVRRLGREIAISRGAAQFLQQAHNELEARVLDRTAELATANESLLAENAERKRAEESLRESEERFSGAFEHAPIGIALVSPQGRWLKVNRSLCAVFGYSEAEMLVRSFQELTYPEDLALSLENVNRMLTGEKNFYQAEKRYVHKGGGLVTALLNVSLVRDSQGQPSYFIAQIQDTTERKKAEESLRLLGSAVEQSKESILITNADLVWPGPKIIFVNPAFTAMTDYTAAEVIGLTPRILQGPHTDKTVLNRLRKNLEQGEVFAGEAINYRKNRTEFVMEWQIAPIRNASGKITHFVAIQHDISERKRLEAQLFQSQKLETVGKLAGGVAHEFNSIMTAIIGQSELLLIDLPPGNPLRKNAIEIRQSGERAAVLTRQLLAYGRKQVLRPENVGLNNILTGMEGSLRHLLGREVDCRFLLAEKLKTTKADAGQIEQVIMNLVMNAAEAMPQGGKLTLETANITLDQQFVGNFPDLKAGEYIMLAVTDTGTGMSEEVKAHAFEPFFTTKGVGEGTGLGLSTCYGIVKQTGGHISVYSESGLGTTFKVFLPATEAETTRPSPPPTPSSLPRGTETILLVEDESALRELESTLLVRLGYTVLVAGNGGEALNLQKQHEGKSIDLLFTDVVMPRMSGKELSERMLALSPHTKILFASAFTENAIIHQGALNPGVAMLQKPFTPSALANKVRELLDQLDEPKFTSAPKTNLAGA